MHSQYLIQALQLAEIRRGFCAPNPAVGAVVVKDEQVLATGFHWAGGQSHAEVDALNKIGEAARGATIYVSLEPCCHVGKTPPCTTLLIQRGITRVVYGMRDPNPQVADKSASILQAAGIECLYLPLPEITEFYQSYQYWWQTQKPFVTAKLAMSMDGKIAGVNGEPITLTGAAAQQFTHQQRKRSDAILTTAKTICCDNPQLNVRLENEIMPKPLYILDSQLITPLTAKIFTTAANITLFHQTKIAAEKLKPFLANNIRCVAVNTENGKLNLNDVLTQIGKEGMQDLWVEAGGECFTSFIQQQFAQRAYIYVAPKWIGETAQNAFKTPFNIFAQARNYAWSALGQDACCEINFYNTHTK